MEAVFAAILILAVPPANVETSATPSTRLFVRTEPRGATLALNGVPIGNSEGLFHVAPGDHRVAVELDGYTDETREIHAPQGRITKLEVTLQKLNRGDSAGKSGSDAASNLVSQGELAVSTRQAMLTVLRQHPEQVRWAGRDGNLLFGIAVKPLPQGVTEQRAVPPMLGLVQMLSVHEVLKAKSLLDHYAASGLTDATTLRQAVEIAAGELQVIGQGRGIVRPTWA